MTLREGDLKTDTGKCRANTRVHKVRVETEAEVALMQPHAKGRQELPAPPEAGRGQKAPPEPCGQHGPADTFIWGFRPPEPSYTIRRVQFVPRAVKNVCPCNLALEDLVRLGFYTKGWRLMPFIVELPSRPHVQSSLARCVRWPHSPRRTASKAGLRGAHSAAQRTSGGAVCFLFEDWYGFWIPPHLTVCRGRK